METVAGFIFLASKLTTYGDCRYEIKRRLLLERKAMRNPDSVLKSRDITLLTKVRIVKAVVFPVVMYGCESWTIKKAEWVKVTQSCPTVCDPMDCSQPGSSVLHYLLEFAQTHVHWVDVSFSISPCNEYSGLIALRIDGFDLLAVQGTLKNLLQNHSSKASILWRSAFFMIQLSHPYMTTGKTIALALWTFVCEVMSLLFNTLSGFVITFLPRSKHFLHSWRQSLSTVILEPKKIKSLIHFLLL